MNFAQTIDFDALMEPVALRLLGKPTQQRNDEWRYGNHGSLAVDIKNGRWFDHEANVGGGVLDLIRRQGYGHPAAWLRREGLMAQPPVVSHTKPRIIKVYDYTDETGEILFQVIRYEPKDFRQRRPDGRGGWIWNLQDARRVPYRLPELVKAVAAGEIVYIPEGEKDVDNLHAIGLAATTNPGGIKKWRDEYSEYLRGADVVVLPDNHTEGREHGEQVAASLRGVAKRIRVLDIGKHWSDCPVKGDVSDWLTAGGSAEKLREMAAALPDVSATADNHRSATAQPREVWGDSATWPEPDMAVLRLHRRPPPPLPLQVFGDRWARWIEDTARAAACPVDYVAAPLLASASVSIGHARWAQAKSSWAEPPHLWCASVGDSGDGKSPGADVFYRHVLPEMERRMTADFPDRLRDARATIEAAKAREEHWKTEVREAVKAKRAPPLSPSPAPEEPLAPRLMLSDVTIERIAMLLARAAPKGVLMTRDELAGWFLGMNAYNEGARAFWIEAYGGRPYRLDRVKHSEPINIARLAVGWHGGIQPPRLAEVMREADDGLLARFVWFWPNPVPFDIADCAPDVDWVVRAFDRLRMLDLAPGEKGAPSRPIVVPLDAAALQQLAKFGRLLQKERDGSGGLLHSAVGKARGLALRLSLVIAYLCWCAEEGYGAPPEVITEDIFLAAAKLVAEYVLPMAERTFGDAACPAVDRNAATLAHWIAREPPTEVHVRHLQREVRLPGLTTAEAIHAACKVLVEAGWLKEPPSGTFQHRSRATYQVSPRLGEALEALK